MFASIKHSILHAIHSLISRFWVQPLEARIIPALENKPGRLAKFLLHYASGSAKAGWVAVNAMRPLKIRWVGPDWSVTYLGNGERVELLCSFLFPTPPQEVESTQVFLWQVQPLIRKHTKEGDLVICELNERVRLSPTRGKILSFVTPQSIQQVIVDFDRPLDAIKADFQHHTRQRIQHLEAQGYSYEATYSEADFDLFYHRMYIPYIKERHTGHSVNLWDYDYMHSLFRKGVLILVKKDGEPVAGGLRYLEGDTCTAIIMGVLDGRYDLVKQGCVVALGWFGILWAHQQGARYYNFGSSFPLTSNGPFNFKRQWGTRVVPDGFNQGYWKFMVKDLSNPLRGHLNKLGLITAIDEKFYQVHLHDPTETNGEAKLESEIGHVSHCGLAGIAMIYTAGERRLIPIGSAKGDVSGQPSLRLHHLPAP